MAVSALGNLTFINQNTQVGASAQAQTQHRGDLANLANMQDFKQKLEGVQEVRKLEENDAINPDKDSEKQSFEGEQRQREQSQEKKEPKPSDHLLDIRA